MIYHSLLCNISHVTVRCLIKSEAVAEAAVDDKHFLFIFFEDFID